jgi:hypothetical protein
MHGLPNATAIPEYSIMDDTSTVGIEWLQVKHCFGNESSLVHCDLHKLEEPLPYYINGIAGVICGLPKGKT